MSRSGDVLRHLALLWLSLVCAIAHADMTGQQRAEAAGRGLVGWPGPRLVLKTIDGNEIDLGSLYGRKAVYLKFWATWCTPCREQMPHFERTYETAGPDLAVIAVNAGFDDSLEEVRAYRRKLGIKMPIVIDDGTLGAALNLRVTPQHVVIGRDGSIQYIGHLADAQLDAALVAARAPVAAAGAGGGVNRAPKKAPRYGVGDLLPAFSVQTLEGRSFHAREIGANAPTVLVFLSPWCESYLATTRPILSANCRGVREQVDALARDGRVRWLGIASGIWATEEDLRNYQIEHKIRIPLVLDESGDLFREFRVMNVPTVLIANSRGTIVHLTEGSNVHLPEELRAMLAHQ
jgi:thiol-disulfide isomerase/thioredoxin